MLWTCKHDSLHCLCALKASHRKCVSFGHVRQLYHVFSYGDAPRKLWGCPKNAMGMPQLLPTIAQMLDLGSETNRNEAYPLESVLSPLMQS